MKPLPILLPLVTLAAIVVVGFLNLLWLDSNLGHIVAGAIGAVTAWAGELAMKGFGPAFSFHGMAGILLVILAAVFVSVLIFVIIINLEPPRQDRRFPTAKEIAMIASAIVVLAASEYFLSLLSGIFGFAIILVIYLAMVALLLWCVWIILDLLVRFYALFVRD